MHHAQRATYAVAIAPGPALDNATATAVPVDTIGARYCEISVQLGATDIAMTALKVQECDTVDGTYTDIPGADFDGGTDIDGETLELPSATDDNQTCVFQINLDNRLRFLKVIATAGNGSVGTFIMAVARLSELRSVPETSEETADGGVRRI
ncbi:hypothetical protein [Rhodopirellula sp. MGV]|uniref:hypothetical protein n=1 Tax=Rhodopirellula sp. MGV TaxID=2023130 RepID=UPI000B9792C6|nr:hypothetical protein [Rhodopirellula sp. MGV]OYP38899.1 hypothetical protein CGZ80_01380 [Rhodopirellula sp. MGV]PNY38287.1 hypothetical protein C2E31_02955 [Rhodopirellula baltica]